MNLNKLKHEYKILQKEFELHGEPRDMNFNKEDRVNLVVLRLNALASSQIELVAVFELKKIYLFVAF